MTRRDIRAIEFARNVKKYCGEHERCAGCVLRGDDDSCVLGNSLAVHWALPTVTTYKRDFLSKFPNARFESSNLCRKMIYGEEYDCCGMTCQECWEGAYIEK